MKKTILSLAVAEIIIGVSMQTKAHAATINYTNAINTNDSVISTFQNSGKILSIGSKGDVVKSLQRLLNYLEGCNIKEDGVYGAETYNAIIKYQGKNGLKQDGIVGKQTVAKLLSTNTKTELKSTNSKVADRVKAADIKTVNERIKAELNSKEINSDTNYFIAVSKSKGQIYIYYKETDSWVNTKVFSCNIGQDENSTIEGDFHSGLKGKELRINETSVKYFTQISGNYLFHSFPYNEEGEVVDSCLGEDVSHECIMLSLEDAKYIYEAIPARTGIKIIK